MTSSAVFRIQPKALHRLRMAAAVNGARENKTKAEALLLACLKVQRTAKAPAC